VDPVPDPLLLRKSGSTGNRTRDLWVCSQEVWLLDHRGGQIMIYKCSVNPIINPNCIYSHLCGWQYHGYHSWFVGRKIILQHAENNSCLLSLSCITHVSSFVARFNELWIDAGKFLSCYTTNSRNINLHAVSSLVKKNDIFWDVAPYGFVRTDVLEECASSILGWNEFASEELQQELCSYTYWDLLWSLNVWHL
jgi:hypothetical protein